ncbi:AhpC/TSA family protein [Sphingomonas sp. CGMCC 1.13654]|uniref:thioredoxin-dependent peroxiredoxin n=1 Tax=Sphingomonas chungangi TaxID=2683589 RepID=A0A838L1B8_9SPHN|nr:peroxiredoxin-like family protein [Sphingomonas chungangi]MBA2933151.1 AhpC/TSA family protein [Sphingomonas chungangi]MVW57823.1 redoxin domain-containing protein [Sphingomonas chungangi]
MPEQSPLASAFAALQQERESNWAAEALAANHSQRRALVKNFDPAKAVRAGDVLPEASFLDLEGNEIRLDSLVADGPAVLILFRHATCAADNLALPIYDRDLREPLAAEGVPLVAVSPQVPERLSAIRERHGLKLTVLSDPDNRFARELGVLFAPMDQPSPPPSGWIGEVTGTGSWELPQTSVLIVDRGRIVRFVAVSPDWLDRVEPKDVFDALRAVQDHPTSKQAAA